MGALFQEFIQLAPLLVENLRDLDAGEVFGQVGVDVGGAVLHLAEHSPGELAENDREKNHKGNEAQHHQRQLVVEQQHGHQHADDDKNVFDHGDQDIGKHHGNGVGIVGNAGHQLAHGNLVQLLVGQAFNVGEQVLAQGGKNLLSGFLQGDGLHIGACHGDHQHPGVYHDHAEQRGQLKPGLDHLLNAAHQQRRHNVVGDGDQHQRQHPRELLPVGQGIDHQPGHDFPVFHVPVEARVFRPAAHQQVGCDKNDGKHAYNGAHNHQRQKLTHVPRLLPPPGAAGPPSGGRRRRCRTAPDGCPRRLHGRHR